MHGTGKTLSHRSIEDTPWEESVMSQSVISRSLPSALAHYRVQCPPPARAVRCPGPNRPGPPTQCASGTGTPPASRSSGVQVAVSCSVPPLRIYQRACSPPINELERPGQERLQISLQGVYTRYKPGAVYSVLLLDSSMPLVLTSCLLLCECVIIQ